MKKVTKCAKMMGIPEKNQKTPLNFIFHPKVWYNLPCYSPGNLEKLGRVVLYKVIEKMACTAHSYYKDILRPALSKYIPL